MEIKLNLASKPYVNRQRLRLWLLLAGGLLAALLALGAWSASQDYRQLSLLSDRIAELQAQSAGSAAGGVGYTPEMAAVVQAETALANEIVAADQFRWTRLMGRLEELVPADVSLRTLQPDFKTRSVQLAGVARDVSGMTRFMDNLLQSEDFKQAYLERHGEVESRGAGGPDYQVGFSLVIRGAF